MGDVLQSLQFLRQWSVESRVANTEGWPLTRENSDNRLYLIEPYGFPG